ELGHGVDVREGVAELAEAPGDRLGRGRQPRPRKDIPRLEFDQFGELFVAPEQLARHFEAGDRVLLAFLDGHRDGDVLTGWLDRYLDRFDRELEVPTIQLGQANRI